MAGTEGASSTAGSSAGSSAGSTSGLAAGPTLARSRWQAFDTDAPDLAERVRARFASNLHHVIGTLRRNGAPRLSGTEVDIGLDGVRLGMMAGSHKLADVRRDPRVEIHSAPLEQDLAEGDVKLAGQLVEVQRDEPGHAGAGWFELVLEGVSLVRVEADELVFDTWQPERGHHVTRRR